MRDNGGELEWVEGVRTCWTPDPKPEQMCERCGTGPFFYVSRREYPTLCLDCADAEIVSQRVPLNYTGPARGAWGERFEYEGDKFDPCIEDEDIDA